MCFWVVQVLVVATTVLGMRQGFGVVENSISLGPLSLRSSLRLFARLAPALVTAEQKAAFVGALMPARSDITVRFPAPIQMPYLAPI